MLHLTISPTPADQAKRCAGKTLPRQKDRAEYFFCGNKDNFLPKVLARKKSLRNFAPRK
jgi:hypothetical protein